ncbi:hypothetical protein AGR4C_pb20002 [Agrobacterium tumefaciens str. Kerr 14]|uniref:Uncharacterized protein n=1 Tax=Agrobacterium tumefaciens str. Kerr 14 TaxID=1183424 RepID=A0A1S7SDJ3_AGRTU|nr:hypothetical protein AGR4C_pb20002 [Agrobacterium tumefaciens str. Kerr 14]
MAHGNQGPKWWFAMFGSQSSNAGAARAVTMIVIFVVAASAILYLAKS